MSRRLTTNRLGINGKVMLVCVVMALAVAAVTSFLSFSFGYRNMREASFQELLGHAEVILEQEPQRGERLRVPSLESIAVYQKLADALVFFVDMDYVTVHIPDDAQELNEEQSRMIAKKTQIISAIDQQYITRALMGETVKGSRTFEFVRGEMLFVCKPLRNEAETVVGALVLMQPINKLMELWNAFRSALGLAALVALAFSLPLAWRLSRGLTRRLLGMIQTARRIGEGEYHVRVEPQTTDELGELGATINALTARLSDTIERLMGERDQLEIIMSSIDEGIIAIDTAEKITRFNQAFLALMEIDGIQGLESADRPDAARLSELLRRCLYSRKRQRDVWVTPSGRTILALVSPLLGNNREILGGVALLQDVSESERLEQLRRDYVANVSHELRTPLTGIRGMVEPLLDGYIDTEEEKQDCYQVIYKETLRLEKLIGDMLDVSRLQDGHVQLDMETLDVRGVVATAIRRIQVTADEEGVAVCARLPEGALTCRGDENRILQVLTIFLDNALSFTPTGGEVIVYAQNERDGLRLGVRDNGVGIEPKDLPLIWERFYKSDKSRMRTSGTGLGLAIAKLTVERMGGEIGVESQPGKGSDFYFILRTQAAGEK